MNASAFSEPFTPRGVASFAGAKFSRLLIAQIIVAILAGAAVSIFCRYACFPIIESAIENLPPDGQIHFGQLEWTGAPQMLAEGRFLALDVDPDHTGQLRSAADIQVEFGRDSARIFSLFGYTDFYYLPNESAPFNRAQLDPLWKAWRAEIFFLVAFGTAISLLLSWWALALVYFLPVYLIAFFANRDLSLPGSLKLSAAALLPGALMMTAGIVLYTSAFFGLPTLLFIFGAHLVLAWLYLLVSLMFFVRTSSAPVPGNPFKPGKTS